MPTISPSRPACTAPIRSKYRPGQRAGCAVLKWHPTWRCARGGGCRRVVLGDGLAIGCCLLRLNMSCVLGCRRHKLGGFHLLDEQLLIGDAGIHGHIVRAERRKTRRLFAAILMPKRMGRLYVGRYREIHGHRLIAYHAHRVHLVYQGNTHLTGSQFFGLSVDGKLTAP